MTEPANSFTNSSMSCARACPRRYKLRYVNMLAEIEGDREALTVGSCWHDAHAAVAVGQDPYAVIHDGAPGIAWRTKLNALFAGYQWYYREDDIEIVEAEVPFEIPVHGIGWVEGVRDAGAKFRDESVLVERKTTASDIAPEARYWDKLRLDTQVGIYELGMIEIPRAIVYDVVRKPTIKPKKVTKAGRAEIEGGSYHGREFHERSVEDVIADLDGNEGRETWELYGMRLLADITERPEFYFARRTIPRTNADRMALREDIISTIQMIRSCHEHGFPRNPSACDDYGGCEFLRLCASNENPELGQIPAGYVERGDAHPEVTAAKEAAEKYGMVAE